MSRTRKQHVKPVPGEDVMSMALLTALVRARPKVPQGRFYCQVPTARLINWRTTVTKKQHLIWALKAHERRMRKNLARLHWAARGGDRLWEHKSRLAA